MKILIDILKVVAICILSLVAFKARKRIWIALKKVVSYIVKPW